MFKMADYRITCTRQAPVTQPHSHAHIVSVGTGGDNGYDKIWTVAQVYAAMDRGDRFWTLGKKSGQTAWVSKMKCPACPYGTLRANHDDVSDNNLDSLPNCT
jgi:hypothetical protein